jgi:hypothetical protein
MAGDPTLEAIARELQDQSQEGAAL